ncbi:hypothetical protein AK812_SmicGene59 [Symbiodinium microadriaticum]|uniref:Uncharacterized protein n=1 Tax=Symbiodinium microadriaticum TaxID=2951 RepID=A0A1Q9F7P7_SYMMI|nr:hypothetical protein AK812_SmicGene59 [Symbiodinium microadriaticum]
MSCASDDDDDDDDYYYYDHDDDDDDGEDEDDDDDGDDGDGDRDGDGDDVGEDEEDEEEDEDEDGDEDRDDHDEDAEEDEKEEEEEDHDDHDEDDDDDDDGGDDDERHAYWLATRRLIPEDYPKLLSAAEAANELISEHGENVHYLAAKKIYEVGIRTLALRNGRRYWTCTSAAIWDGPARLQPQAANELISEHGENVHYLAAKKIYEALSPRKRSSLHLPPL